LRRRGRPCVRWRRGLCARGGALGEEDRQIPNERDESARQRVVISNLDPFEDTQERFDLRCVQFALPKLPHGSFVGFPCGFECSELFIFQHHHQAPGFMESA